MVLKSALYVKLPLNDFIFLFVLFAQFYHFDAVFMTIKPIFDKKDLSSTTFTKQLYLFKILGISRICDNWEIKDTLLSK